MIIYEVLSRKIPQILSRKIFSTKMAWQESRCVFAFLAILLCGFHNGISATSKLDSILQTIDESLTDLDRKADFVSFEFSQHLIRGCSASLSPEFKVLVYNFKPLRL